MNTVVPNHKLWVEIITGGSIYRGPVVAIEFTEPDFMDFPVVRGNLLYLDQDGTIGNLAWEKAPHRIITEDPDIIIYPEGVEVWMQALKQR